MALEQSGSAGCCCVRDRPAAHRLEGLAGGLKETERPRMAQSLIGLVLETGYQRYQQSHPKPARLLALANAPALKFVAVGKIESLEEINLKRLRRLTQDIG